MVDRGLHVDPRHAEQSRQRLEVESARSARGRAAGERADAHRVAVGREHRDRLAHVLGGVAVHHHAVRVSSPRIDISGEITNAPPPSRIIAGLKRRERAQRRAEEQERQHLACERARLGVSVEPVARARGDLDLLAREVGEVVKARIVQSPPGRRPASARARLKISGGSRRSTCGSALVPVRMSRSSSASRTAVAFGVVLQAEQEAAALHADDGPDDAGRADRRAHLAHVREQFLVADRLDARS